MADQPPQHPTALTPSTSGGPSSALEPPVPTTLATVAAAAAAAAANDEPAVTSAPDRAHDSSGSTLVPAHLGPRPSPPAAAHPASHQVRGQALGRRRRASDGQSGADEDLSTRHPEVAHHHRAKRRRAEGTMSATARSNGEAASKAGTAYANGTSHSLSSHSANANGTHKASMANGSSPARNSEPYFGHDREEVTRLIIQALADMGYHSSADGLSKESGYELESPVVASFRQAVLAGDWDDAERLLFGTDTDDAEGATPKSAGLALTQTAEPDLMRFWIRQQKLLELLEKGETSQALTVLRTELTPLNQESKRIPSLSTLFMCQHGDELKARAQWDGANGNSRRLLLSELSSKLLPPLAPLRNARAVG